MSSTYFHYILIKFSRIFKSLIFLHCVLVLSASSGVTQHSSSPLLQWNGFIFFLYWWWLSWLMGCVVFAVLPISRWGHVFNWRECIGSEYRRHCLFVGELPVKILFRVVILVGERVNNLIMISSRDLPFPRCRVRCEEIRAIFQIYFWCSFIPCRLFLRIQSLKLRELGIVSEYVLSNLFRICSGSIAIGTRIGSGALCTFCRGGFWEQCSHCLEFPFGLTNDLPFHISFSTTARAWAIFFREMGALCVCRNWAK